MSVIQLHHLLIGIGNLILTHEEPSHPCLDLQHRPSASNCLSPRMAYLPETLCIIIQAKIAQNSLDNA